jgi:hypothetical protein
MYCEICGKENVSEPTGRFDKSTGKPATVEVCPDACKHGLHNDICVPARSFFERLFNGFRYRCSRCGRVAAADTYTLD